MKGLVLVNRPAEYKENIETMGKPSVDMDYVDGRKQEVFSGATSCQDISWSDYDFCLGSPEYIMPIIDKMSSLRWVQSTHAGVDGFIDQGFPDQVQLTGVKDIFGDLMAEYVIGQLIMYERGSIAQWENQKQQRWKRWVPGTISNKKAIIFGTGSIGTGIAKQLSAFGIKSYGINSSGDVDKEVYESGATIHSAPYEKWDADYVINTLPLTSHTKDVFNVNLFNQLPTKSILVNVGRGGSVNEEDLVEALENKRIRAAILDVFKTEPLPRSHPFWSTKELIVSPHNGAITPPSDIANLFNRNLDLFLNGQPLEFLIDTNKGY